MTRKAFYLTDLHVKRLRKLTRETGMTEAEHVRRALDEYFKSRDNGEHKINTKRKE